MSLSKPKETPHPCSPRAPEKCRSAASSCLSARRSQVNSELSEGSFPTACRKRGLRWSHKQKGMISSSAPAIASHHVMQRRDLRWVEYLCPSHLRRLWKGIKSHLPFMKDCIILCDFKWCCKWWPGAVARGWPSPDIAYTSIPRPEVGSRRHRPGAAPIPGDSSFQTWFEVVRKLLYKW